MSSLLQRYVGSHRLRAVGLTCVLALSLVACSSGGGPADSPNSNPAVDPNFDPNDVVPPPSEDLAFLWLFEAMDFSIFLTLLQEADLQGALFDEQSQWTVFAIPDRLQAGELAMVEGSVEVVVGADGKVTLGGSTIVARDRIVANGVIHLINAPMMPADAP